jgi:hypothetical protein
MRAARRSPAARPARSRLLAGLAGLAIGAGLAIAGGFAIAVRDRGEEAPRVGEPQGALEVASAAGGDAALLRAEGAEAGGPDLARAFPDWRLMGDVREPSTAQLCDGEAWSGARDMVEAAAAGEVYVDEARWRARPVSAQVGLASWLSKCTQSGAPLAIRASGSRALLARYDPASGYAPEGPLQ